MQPPAKFEWDDAKAASNEAKHAISFPIATLVFLDPNRLLIDASHLGDGEARLKAVGVVQARLITVVFTPRGNVCRVISARRSNSNEERSYGNRSL